MDDKNNNNGYDDFFSSSEAARSNENNDVSDTESMESTDSRASHNEPGTKPSYYYSYGPLSGELSQSNQLNESNQTEQSDRASRTEAPYDQQEETSQQYAQSAPAQPPLQSQSSQLRTFTTQQSAKGTWQVREPRRTSFKSIFLSFLAGVLVVGGLMYTADVRNWFTPGQANEMSSNSQGGTQQVSAQVNGGSSSSAIANRPDNIAQLFETSSPAVVKIETYVNRTSRSRSGSSLFDDPFFRQFFGDNYPGQVEPQEEGQMQQTGIGTGFFFESSGYILTNQHVIGDSDEIKVTVKGYDEPFTAKLMGSSYELDLAVVKIEGDHDFPTLPLGSSDQINIGDWVVAIGNPYGFDHTLTVGVLSAKERPIDIQDTQGDRHYKHLLQTDASINPGNSGGPLLNVNGEVIGINTAVSSQAQGIGFAIPTSTIQEVLDSLKNNKEIPKPPVPFIGAELYQITDEYAKQLGLDKAEGSLVKSVYYNSPAYLADLKQFDVIVGIDGKKFPSMTGLVEEIQKRNIGDKIELNIIRKGNTMNLEVEIGDKNVFGIE